MAKKNKCIAVVRRGKSEYIEILPEASYPEIVEAGMIIGAGRKQGSVLSLYLINGDNMVLAQSAGVYTITYSPSTESGVPDKNTITVTSEKESVWEPNETIQESLL